MRRFISILVAGLIWSALPAYADTFLEGKVVEVENDGIYLQKDQEVTYVSSGYATYRVHNLLVSIGELGPGMTVQAYYQPSLVPQWIPVDYYNTHHGWDWTRYQLEWQNERPHGNVEKSGANGE